MSVRVIPNRMVRRTNRTREILAADSWSARRVTERRGMRVRRRKRKPVRVSSFWKRRRRFTVFRSTVCFFVFRSISVKSMTSLSLCLYN